jgi:copper oxidase (laccase) domain-containing protein
LPGPASLDVAVSGGTARIRFTTRADGDLHADLVPADELEARRRALVDLPATWLDEVHGTCVVTVTRPGEHAGTTADASVTDVVGAALGIWVGDCAPVALVAPEGVIGAAHAGWRGVVAGVLPSTVRAMRRLGASAVVAHVGPYVHPECYEFGLDDLDAVEARLGPTVRATTAIGMPALDMGAAIAASLAEEDVAVASFGPCTACSTDHWSRRARADLGRHGMVVWLEVG